MNWLVRKIINKYSDQVYKWAFTQQKPVDWMAQCEVAFIDSNGKKYYRYKNDFDMPIARYEQIQIYLMEFESRMKRATLEEWIAAANDVLNKKKADQFKLEMGYLLGALKERSELLFEPDILLNIALAQYIREDESPFLWSDEIQKEKVEQLKKEKGEGLFFFFQEAGLSAYLPRLITSEESYKLFTVQMRAQIKLFEAMLEKLRSEPKSTSG